MSTIEDWQKLLDTLSRLQHTHATGKAEPLFPFIFNGSALELPTKLHATPWRTEGTIHHGQYRGETRWELGLFTLDPQIHAKLLESAEASPAIVRRLEWIILRCQRAREGGKLDLDDAAIGDLLVALTENQQFLGRLHTECETLNTPAGWRKSERALAMLASLTRADVGRPEFTQQLWDDCRLALGRALGRPLAITGAKALPERFWVGTVFREGRGAIVATTRDGNYLIGRCGHLEEKSFKEIQGWEPEPALHFVAEKREPGRVYSDVFHDEDQAATRRVIGFSQGDVEALIPRRGLDARRGAYAQLECRSRDRCFGRYDPFAEAGAQSCSACGAGIPSGWPSVTYFGEDAHHGIQLCLPCYSVQLLLAKDTPGEMTEAARLVIKERPRDGEWRLETAALKSILRAAQALHIREEQERTYSGVNDTRDWNLQNKTSRARDRLQELMKEVGQDYSIYVEYYRAEPLAFKDREIHLGAMEWRETCLVQTWEVDTYHKDPERWTVRSWGAYEAYISKAKTRGPEKQRIARPDKGQISITHDAPLDLGDIATRCQKQMAACNGFTIRFQTPGDLEIKLSALEQLWQSRQGERRLTKEERLAGLVPAAIEERIRNLKSELATRGIVGSDRRFGPLLARLGLPGETGEQKLEAFLQGCQIAMGAVAATECLKALEELIRQAERQTLVEETAQRLLGDPALLQRVVHSASHCEHWLRRGERLTPHEMRQLCTMASGLAGGNDYAPRIALARKMLIDLAPLTELQAVAELEKAGLIRAPKELLLATILPDPDALLVDSKVVWDKESHRLLPALRDQLDANGVPLWQQPAQAALLLNTTEERVKKVLSFIPRRQLVPAPSLAQAFAQLAAVDAQITDVPALSVPTNVYRRPTGTAKLCKVLALVDGVSVGELLDKRVSGNQEWTVESVSNLCQQLQCELKDGRVWHKGAFKVEQELSEIEQITVRTIQQLGGVAHRQTILGSVPPEVAVRIEANLGVNPCVRRVGQCLYSLVGRQVDPATIEALGETGRTADGRVFARLRIGPDMTQDTIIRQHGLPDGHYQTVQGHQIRVEGCKLQGLTPLVGGAATGTLKIVVDPPSGSVTTELEPDFPELGARWLAAQCSVQPATPGAGDLSHSSPPAAAS